MLVCLSLLRIFQLFLERPRILFNDFIIWMIELVAQAANHDK